jgi:hypothetical protein
MVDLRLVIRRKLSGRPPGFSYCLATAPLALRGPGAGPGTPGG